MVEDDNLYSVAQRIIMLDDIREKCRASLEAVEQWHRGDLKCLSTPAPQRIAAPGRPHKPLLVTPKDLPKRSPHTEQGRVALLHAIAHIEFNAIHLAWDAVYRFRDMPHAYYSDWVQVAADETRHFQMLQTSLSARGHEYGDFPAHDGLWDMAVRTDHDVLIRMALVPRVLEARGLDVTPRMITQLNHAGDRLGAALLKTIYQDEIVHVAIGSHWFKYCCQQRNLKVAETFKQIVQDYLRGGLRGPYNLAARRQAGFEADELTQLELASKMAHK